MKRKYVYKSQEIILGSEITQCVKCLHFRVNEPYARKTYSYGYGKLRTELICWRCCRDVESTWLIQQMWPLAFERTYNTRFWYLQWTPGVKALIGETDET